MAVLLAAMHPERVSVARALRQLRAPHLGRGLPWARRTEEREAYTDLLVTRWDWEAGPPAALPLRRRAPCSAGGRSGCGPRRRPPPSAPCMDMNSLVDVRELLPSIRVPTLVVHRESDAMFDVGEAHYLAEHIPGAELRLLEGADHFVSGDPAQILDAVEPFIAATPVPAQHRALAAVVVRGGSCRLRGDARAGRRRRPAPPHRRRRRRGALRRSRHSSAGAVRGRLGRRDGGRDRAWPSPRWSSTAGRSPGKAWTSPYAGAPRRRPGSCW